MSYLINLASGYLPISLSDVPPNVFTRVINYDPLDESILTGMYGAILRDELRKDPNTFVTIHEHVVDRLCPNTGA